MTTPNRTRKRFSGARAALVAGVVNFALVALADAATTPARRVEFAIPAAPALESFKEFAAQAGIQLLYAADIAAGVKTNAVKGELTPREAIDRMLAGTPLTAQQTGNGAIVVRKGPPDPNGQRAAPPTAGDRPNQTPGDAARDPEAPIELSPFKVTADQDVGYLAGNSLAGSRLNTRLKDTAASISVMTEEFLRDIAAHDISEALEFGNNLQLDRDDAGDFGDFPGGNPTIELPQTYRVRGIRATTARNGFEWKLSTDAYNVERIEDSRGPNSILFGIGSAGGVINVSTKQANLHRNLTKLQGGAGSFESWRGVFDHNQVLLGKKLGVRLSALWNHSNTHRHYAFTESRRVHLATKYQATKNTKVRTEFQYDEVDQNVPRSNGLNDYSTAWIRAGRPTFATTASTTEFSQYGTRLAANQFRYISNRQELLAMTGQILTSSAPTTNFPIVDNRIADPSINTGGPGQNRRNESHAVSAFVEQKLGGKTFVELAFNHQEYIWRSYDPQYSFRFYGDANQDLPGTLGANPFAGRSFLETWWRIFDRAESSDTGRLSIATEINARKWGLYRCAALGEYEKRRSGMDIFWEVWEGHPFNAAPENSANRVIRRSYVTTGDWKSYFVEGPSQAGLIKGMREPVTGRTLSSYWVREESQDDPTTQNSGLLSLQAIYFGGRLVVGTGYRLDKTYITDRTKKRNPATAEWERDYETVKWLNASASTRTLGVVAHPTKNISLLYNQASNFGLPDSRIRILPNVAIAPGSEGEGQDYGIGLDLLGGRIYARAVRFTTASRGEQSFSLTGGDGFVGTSNAIFNGLLAANLITQADFDVRSVSLVNGSTSDREAKGYEFQLTANPMKNWRLQANWSLTEGAQTNIGLEVRSWWARVKPYFQSFPQDTPTTGVNTIGMEIAQFEEFMANALSVEGLGTIGNRKLKANFITRYAFTGGLLKGAYVGSGYRYQGKMLLGRVVSTGALLWGKPVGEASLLAGYAVPLKRSGQRMSVQLNVSNLFDETDYIISRRNTTGPRSVIPRNPRAWRVSTDYSF